MGFFSGGKTTSESYSGLRGTSQFQPLIGQLGSGFQFGMDTARQRVGELNPLGLNASGLTDAQSRAFETLGKNLFGNVSSNYASRGFLSPESVSGVIGSSLQQAAPQLMGQIFQNQMGQQQVLSDRFSALNQLLGTGTGLAGQESKSVTKGSNMLGGALAGAIGKWASPDWMVDIIGGASKSTPGGSAAGGAALFCWVAEALYGVDAPKTHLARWYVNVIMPRSIGGRLFRRIYALFGRKIAAMIPLSPVLRKLLEPIFDRLASSASRMLAK